jgi:predicted Na+-dependent transporter
MKVKEFLKPSWRKLIIFLIIVFLSFTIGRGNYGGILTVVGVFYNPIFWLPLGIVYGSFVIIESEGHLLRLLLEYSPRLLIGFILTIFYWYILSCLAIWLYDRIIGGKK